MADLGICAVEACGKGVKARGWCALHYQRWQATSDPLGVKPRTNGTSQQWLLDHADWQDDECLPWPFARSEGRYPCAVMLDGIKEYAHRQMCRLRNGPPSQPDMDAAHSCGNGLLGCVNPKHLRWATREQNMQDAVGHGTTCVGTKNHANKLTEDQVREIRAMAGTMMQKDIARIYGVAHTTVSSILRGKMWAWLK